jgi:hypothetical protein
MTHGHRVQVDVAGQAGDQLGDGHAFLETLVREHRAANAVAHCPDAFDAGVAVLVDDDASALVDLDASAFGQQLVGGGAAADGDQQPVDGDGLLAVLVGVGDLDRLFPDLGLRDLGAQLDGQALLVELAARGLGDVGIGGAEEGVHCLEHRHFRAQALPHAAQLQADDAGADDAQTLRHRSQIERASVVDDVFAVERHAFQLDRYRAGRDDDVRARDLRGRAVLSRDLHRAVRQQLAEAVIRRDLVGLEQLHDAARELLHDLVLAADHRSDIDRRLLRRDAVVLERMFQVVELLGGIQQRLGGDAADVEAGAAQGGLAVLADVAVDAGRLQAKLGGADGGVVAGRAGTDDDDVELFGHDRFLGACPFSRGDPMVVPFGREGGAKRRMRVRRSWNVGTLIRKTGDRSPIWSCIGSRTLSPTPLPGERGLERASDAQQHPVRVFQLVLDVDQEQHRVLAVDDAVVVAERDVHHRRGSRPDAVLGDRALLDRVHAEDADCGVLRIGVDISEP